MAIKVNGTTVIDDSRNLSNVGGLKTVNGTSLVGSGNISAGGGTTTTVGNVGSLTWGGPLNTTKYYRGNTASGIRTIMPNSTGWPIYYYGATNTYENADTVVTESGTWRCLVGRWARNDGGSTGYGNISLWVRIS